MVSFKVEPFSEFFSEAIELLKLHWEEVAPYKDIFTINPELTRYHFLEENGNLCVVAARDEGKLIGYIVMIIAPHHHYQHILAANDDLHFIHKDYRRGGLGSQMFKFVEEEMKKLGVKFIAMRTKVSHDHGKLFTHLGYEAMDVIYTKKLEA